MEKNQNDENSTGALHKKNVLNDSKQMENLTEAQAAGSHQKKQCISKWDKEKKLSRSRKASIRLALIAASILIILAVTGASLTSCSKSKRMDSQPQAEPEFRYAMLESSWNQYAANYPAKFKLFGDRGGSDANIIKALNHWLYAFSRQPDLKYLDELNKLRKTYGVTAFHAWDDFRREHHRQRDLTLNTEMSYADLSREINNYIGIARPQNPQDFISADTVKTIVYMNSICAFFDGEKDGLHKEGIDTEIYECPKLDPGDKFPILQHSLKAD